MRKNWVVCVGFVVMLAVAGGALQYGIAQEKAVKGSVSVKVHYTGTGTVDDKHRIMVFLFDSPGFVRGEAMPFAVSGTNSKDGTVTFNDVAKSPVYVGVIFAPAGGYDGQSGPPPSGSSMGMYSKTAGEPAPVNVESGKTAAVSVEFDDSIKMQ